MPGYEVNPLRVSEGFWTREQVQLALRTRDIAALFRLLRKYEGVSQTRIGVAVGLEQGYISKIMNSRRRVSSIDLLDRIATGCEMPDLCRILLGLAPREASWPVDIRPRSVVWQGSIERPATAESDEPAIGDSMRPHFGRRIVEGPDVSGRGISDQDRFAIGSEWPIWVGSRVAYMVGVVDDWNTNSISSDALQSLLHQEMLMLDAIAEDGSDTAHAISRRQALATLAALPLTFGSPGAESWRSAPATESFLSRCAASLTACWHMLRGSDLLTVHNFLSTYLLQLEGMAQQPSRYQATAARLASQAHRICGIIALHQNRLRTREYHCQRALYYAVASSDANCRASALISLASTYFYASDPVQAAAVYEQALALTGETSQLQQSRVLAELSVVYGQLGREQESLRSAEQAEHLYPANPEQDPSYLYAEFTRASLTLERGLSYVALADRYPGRRYQRVAADIFARVDQATPTAVPERIRYEIVNHQARTAVSLRDLDSFELFITRSIDGVVLLRSKQRQKEMLTALQYAMETWPHERRLRVISEQVRPAITAFAGTEPPGMEA